MSETVRETDEEVDEVTTVAFAEEKRNTQNLTVKGKVIDSKGTALSGVAVMVKGATVGTVTNDNGDYTLSDVPQGSILVYMLVGYVTYEQKVEKATVNVILVEESQSLSEVIVVAFGSQKKESVLSSIPSEKAEIATDSVPLQTKNNVKPQPVIGKKKYKKYLKENVVMPQSEDCKGKKGVVKLTFSTDATGRPVNIRVKKSLCPEADREAIRLLEQGPVWTSGDREVEIEVKFVSVD
jgi:hypothetical protein